MNGHHANGVDSRHGNRVEEESVPDSPHSPAGMWVISFWKMVVGDGDEMLRCCKLERRMHVCI